jgi:hypothetical protein
MSRNIFHSIAFCAHLMLWTIRFSTIVDSIAEIYVDGKDFSIPGRFRYRLRELVFRSRSAYRRKVPIGGRLDKELVGKVLLW